MCEDVLRCLFDSLSALNIKEDPLFSKYFAAVVFPD